MKTEKGIDKKYYITILIAIIAMILWGCGNSDPKNRANSQDKKTTIILSVAASLSDAMKEIKDAYNSDNPQVELLFNFGSSGALQQQIQQGAPVDIFISAASKQMDDLQERGLIEVDTRRNLLVNKLVLIASTDSNIANIKDLGLDQVRRVAIGEPETVPAGRYAREALISLGLWDSLQPKLILAKDVREVLAFVETGNVEAGLVYQTDAKISNRVKIVSDVPVDAYSPIVYPVAIIANSRNKAAAAQFIEFISSEKGKEILEKYGFVPVAQ